MRIIKFKFIFYSFFMLLKLIFKFIINLKLMIIFNLYELAHRIINCQIQIKFVRNFYDLHEILTLTNESYASLLCIVHSIVLNWSILIFDK